MGIGNVLAELAVKIGVDTGDLNKGLGDAEKKMGSFSDGFLKHSKAIGMGMTVAGGAIVGALGMAMKAAADEEVGIERLRVAMGNVGLAYDDANGSLEKWINSQQQSTAFADDQQREALSGLVVATGDLTKAQGLLSTAMDVARWKNMDLQTASELLMKVYAGDMGMLKRYGIIVTEGATATEALAQMQKMAAGQAEAYAKTAAGQMALLKNNIGDVMEGIGGALIPMLTDLFKQIQPVLETVKEWISENPGLTKTIVIVVAALGGLMMVLGPLLMVLPGIIAALPILGVAFAALTGPVGIIIAAIAALIAIGILVWKNWDTISAKAKEIWGGVVSFFRGVWNSLVSGFENYINVYINGINTIISLINRIPGINLGMIGQLDLSGIKAYASGGIVPGGIGQPQLAMVHGGETIIPAGGAGGDISIKLYIDGEQLSNSIEKRLYDRLRYQEIEAYL